jgi:two-component system sensor histidine kinase AlgZ
MGIALRVLVPLNAAAVLLALALGAADATAPDRLLDILMVLEPAVLVSLATLCALRRWVNGRARPVQWAVGLSVPALVTLVISLLSASVLIPEAGPLATALWAGVRGLAACALAALAFEFFRLRALSFSPSLSEARLQALQARIRPHFLFNSLNTVLGLMRSDPRRAEYTLENLADLFRVFMRDTRELVPLDEEVVTCQQYLAIEQLRLGDRLQVQWHVEQMPGDALLPSLLLQPLIENAAPRIERATPPARSSLRSRGRATGCASRSSTRRPRAPRCAATRWRCRTSGAPDALYDMEAELKTLVEEDQFRLVLEFPYRKERRRRDVRRHFNPYR